MSQRNVYDEIIVNDDSVKISTSPIVIVTPNPLTADTMRSLSRIKMETERVDLPPRFDDVPLEDLAPDPPLPPIQQEPLDPRIEAASKVDVSVWHEQYKRIMGNCIYNMQKSITREDGWTLELESTPCVSLYTRDNDIKIVSILNGRASRFLYVMDDHSMETRMAWDSKYVSMVEQGETYFGDFHVVMSRVTSFMPSLYSDRFLLGIQRTQYEAGIHALYFATAPHYYYTASKSVQGLEVGCFIRQLEREQCEITILIRNAPIPILLRMECLTRLLQRMTLYEQVVKEWDHYYSKK